MPIHNWKPVDAGYFHHFHQSWIIALSNQLNGGLLPTGYYALAERYSNGMVPDLLTLRIPDTTPGWSPSGAEDFAAGGVALEVEPPQTSIVIPALADVYADRANRLVIRDEEHHVVAQVELVSPGNKHSRASLNRFVRKAVECLTAGIHLLIVDLFPPGPRDPQGLHPLIWQELRDDPFELPADNPLTLAAYVGHPEISAYIEPCAVGKPLPEMPLFLDYRHYIKVPLEATYQTTGNVCPKPLRDAVLAAR